jgi:hypothetical protein
MRCEQVINDKTKELCDDKDAKARRGFMTILCDEHFTYVKTRLFQRVGSPITNPRAFRKTSVWR